MRGSTRVVGATGDCKTVAAVGSARVVCAYGDTTLIEIPSPPSSSGGSWFLMIVGGLAIGLALMLPGALLMFPTAIGSVAVASEVAALGALSASAASLSAAFPLACQIAAGALVGSGTSAILYGVSGGDDWAALGKTILTGAIEGAVTAGLSNGAKLSVLQRAKHSAITRVVSQWASNAVDGRPMMDNVVESAVVAAASGGVSQYLSPIKEIPLDEYLPKPSEIVETAALEILQSVAVGSVAAVTTNSVRNVLRGEALFANAGEAMAWGAVSGAVYGVVDAARTAHVRVAQAEIATNRLHAEMDQIARGGPGGLKALLLFCQAHGKSAVVLDAHYDEIAAIGDTTRSDTIALRYTPGDKVGHYERLWTATPRPARAPTGPYTCLGDALDVTPQALASAFTVANARSALRGMSFEQAAQLSGALVGGGHARAEYEKNNRAKLEFHREDKPRFLKAAGKAALQEARNPDVRCKVQDGEYHLQLTSTTRTGGKQTRMVTSDSHAAGGVRYKAKQEGRKQVQRTITLPKTDFDGGTRVHVPPQPRARHCDLSE